ncbi:MAG: MbcA/ParS/Xre antitoxin family protein [Pedobacter sp.]|jgi:putative toxin-antitoxin system antitoxin component (TIGR02293 family)|uniref:antitoxin Xre/MbcA/ParS toxin-binding domain-containing protein n=1 Tax=Pedobacter sp. TaxID=1411316 RepID=UPI0033957729
MKQVKTEMSEWFLTHDPFTTKPSQTEADADSQRLNAMSMMYKYGLEVFDDKNMFERWLRNPNRALGGKIPLNLLDTMAGLKEVTAIIGRLDHGIYS